ncbi:hypothetical protein [Asticcacaulis tiandongensis]|uniref:hypothetical protein n=1 Tax=Asticcacaulis tiandongensis TaxID=2565365 RepID=UPI00112AA6E4|nr:hypothetical protein [Asticcacaulis tiandongensis]
MFGRVDDRHYAAVLAVFGTGLYLHHDAWQAAEAISAPGGQCIRCRIGDIDTRIGDNEGQAQGGLLLGFSWLVATPKRAR